jgi:hypothetical protein
MLQHLEKIELEVRKLLTSQVFRIHFLPKITLRVSKCIICDSSSFLGWGFSNTNNNKPRSKLPSPPTIWCLFVSFGCMMILIWGAPISLGQSLKERWTPWARRNFSSVAERREVPWWWCHDPMLHWGHCLWFFSSQARRDVSAKIEVTPKLGCHGGIKDGRTCSLPGLLGCLDVCQSHSFVGLPKRS